MKNFPVARTILSVPNPKGAGKTRTGLSAPPKGIMNRAFPFQRGFTLLEILVAVTILAVSFTAIFHLFGGTLRNIERSERHARAAVLGGEKLEELLGQIPFPPVGEQGTFPGNPDYSYKTAVEEYKEPVGRKEKNIPHDAAERVALYRLAVKVEWKDGASSKELVLNTLKTVVEPNR